MLTLWLKTSSFTLLAEDKFLLLAWKLLHCPLTCWSFFGFIQNLNIRKIELNDVTNSKSIWLNPKYELDELNLLLFKFVWVCWYFYCGQSLLLNNIFILNNDSIIFFKFYQNIFFYFLFPSFHPHPFLISLVHRTFLFFMLFAIVLIMGLWENFE